MTFETNVAEMDAMIFDFMGVSATYTPAVGDPVSVRVILYENLQHAVLPGGFQRHTEPHNAVDLRQSEFTGKPAQGETIEINSVTYTIAGPPLSDDGYVWRYPIQ